MVRDAFAAKGHDAWSCDLLPTERPGKHLQTDPVPDVFAALEWPWDLMIAHPPCTHLAVSGARWFPLKQTEQAEALDFVRRLLDAPVQRIAMENPVGVISSRIRKPDQIIQPWQFGDEATKTTCLWLKGLPKLVGTNEVARGERTVFRSGKSMPKWYADAFKLSPHDRMKARSVTFPGIAAAMAGQWG